jgi:hypothetical protein
MAIEGFLVQRIDKSLGNLFIFMITGEKAWERSPSIPTMACVYSLVASAAAVKLAKKCSRLIFLPLNEQCIVEKKTKSTEGYCQM